MAAEEGEARPPKAVVRKVVQHIYAELGGGADEATSRLLSAFRAVDVAKKRRVDVQQLEEALESAGARLSDDAVEILFQFYARGGRTTMRYRPLVKDVAMTESRGGARRAKGKASDARLTKGAKKPTRAVLGGGNRITAVRRPRASGAWRRLTRWRCAGAVVHVLPGPAPPAAAHDEAAHRHGPAVDGGAHAWARREAQSDEGAARARDPAREPHPDQEDPGPGRQQTEGGWAYVRVAVAAPCRLTRAVLRSVGWRTST